MDGFRAEEKAHGEPELLSSIFISVDVQLLLG